MAARLLALGCGLLGASLLLGCAVATEGPGTDLPASTPGGGMTGPDIELIDQLRIIDAQIAGRQEALMGVLAATWPSKEQFLAALRETATNRAYEAMFQVAGQLGPPGRLQADLALYVRYLGDSIAFTRGMEQAIKDEDAMAAHLNIVRLFLARGNMLLEAPPAFCEEALVTDTAPGCEPAGPPPGGQYGIDLRAAFRRFSVEFLPRVELFPQLDEPLDGEPALAVLQPEVIHALEEALATVQQLAPPAELREDHDRIIQYFVEALDAAGRLFRGGARDSNALQEELERFSSARLGAADDLSPEARAIVAPFFDE